MFTQRLRIKIRGICENMDRGYDEVRKKPSC
jgi:hypothetical protein